METTENMPDDLFREAKKAAVDRRVTFTELSEQAVRQEPSGSTSFKLEDRSFKGEPGLQPGVDLSDWNRVRQLIYDDA